VDTAADCRFLLRELNTKWVSIIGKLEFFLVPVKLPALLSSMFNVTPQKAQAIDQGAGPTPNKNNRKLSDF
jgi:hypothetical protein